MATSHSVLPRHSRKDTPESESIAGHGARALCPPNSGITFDKLHMSNTNKRREKRTIHCPSFSRAAVREIIREAKKQIPSAKYVLHIHPRAYCVSKPAPWCAVFAIPECDNEPQVAYKSGCLVQHHSASGVKLGDWCSLAYVSTSTCGEVIVVKNLAPS